MTELKIKLWPYTAYVEVTDDYHIKGTFDPNASCDTEYFGVRDTEFEVKTLVYNRRNPAKLPTTDLERDNWAERNYDRLLLAVQNVLDEVDVD